MVEIKSQASCRKSQRQFSQWHRQVWKSADQNFQGQGMINVSLQQRISEFFLPPPFCSIRLSMDWGAPSTLGGQFLLVIDLSTNLTQEHITVLTKNSANPDDLGIYPTV